LWFTRPATNSIGRITTAGIVTTYTGGGITFPEPITAGPDGALWFANATSIGRITTAGVVTHFTGPDIHEPFGITSGPDGALWYSNTLGNSIGRITTAGAVRNYTYTATATGIRQPWDIATGADGALWFTNNLGNSIGRITSAVTPQISAVTPTNGPVGTSVTITGLNLGGATAVTFNGTPATIASSNNTTIVTHVPSGATSGPISVTTTEGTATGGGLFKVT
jgi:virginiamycin B lyase